MAKTLSGLTEAKAMYLNESGDQGRRLEDRKWLDTAVVPAVNDADKQDTGVFAGRNLSFRALGIVRSQGWNLKWNWRNYTTRSGLCGLIWLNAGKLTRTKHSGDRLRELSRSGAWSLEIDGMTFSLNAIISEIFVDRCIMVQEGEGDNRSVMPLDALGGTRNTILDEYADRFWSTRD